MVEKILAVENPQRSCILYVSRSVLCMTAPGIDVQGVWYHFFR